MGYLTHQPGPPLQILVQSIWSSDEDTSKHALLPGLIAPDAHVEFVFQLGAPCEMLRTDRYARRPLEVVADCWEPLPQHMLFAQRTSCVRLRATGRTSMVAFRTSAVVARVLLRRPLHDLLDRPSPLSELLGSDFDHLLTRCGQRLPKRACG